MLDFFAKAFNKAFNPASTVPCRLGPAGSVKTMKLRLSSRKRLLHYLKSVIFHLKWWQWHIITPKNEVDIVNDRENLCENVASIHESICAVLNQTSSILCIFLYYRASSGWLMSWHCSIHKLFCIFVCQTALQLYLIDGLERPIHVAQSVSPVLSDDL